LKDFSYDVKEKYNWYILDEEHLEDNNLLKIVENIDNTEKKEDVNSTLILKKIGSGKIKESALSTSVNLLKEMNNVKDLDKTGK
jgi:hypothetical protein